jgi:N-hydroxyarylamine O-acetyltransferase
VHTEREASAERGGNAALAERGGNAALAERGGNAALAEHDASVWLADVGFGAISLIEPVPLVDGSTSRQRGLTYTLRREHQLWILSMADTNAVQDLYEFSDEPQTEGDVEVANHFTSTHPESIFRKSLTIQGVRGKDRTILRSGVITRYVNGVLEESPIERADLRRHARDLFGIELPRDPLVFDSYADEPS